MGRTVTKSIAIIGEGETEWFYFDSKFDSKFTYYNQMIPYKFD